MPSGIYIRTKSSWNKGIPHSEKTKQKMRISHKQHLEDCSCSSCKAARGEYKGKNHPMYGKHHSKETKQKLSLNRAGKTYEEIYGVKKAKKMRKVQSKWLIGKKRTQKTKKKISIGNTGKIRTLEMRERSGKAALKKVCQRPNEFEKRCLECLDKEYPNKFKYCGDGSKMINGKSPDYISEDLKVIVLCNGGYWHLKQYGLKVNKRNKKAREKLEAKPFIQAGYKVLFIWDDEI